MYQFIFHHVIHYGEKGYLPGRMTLSSFVCGNGYSQAEFTSKDYSTLDEMLVNYYTLIQLTGQIPFPKFLKNGEYIQSSPALYDAYVKNIDTTNALLRHYRDIDALTVKD